MVLKVKYPTLLRISGAGFALPFTLSQTDIFLASRRHFLPPDLNLLS